MKKGLVAVCMFFASSVSAQSWSGGSVVMKDATVLSGLLSLQLDQLVLFKSTDGQIISLPAFRVDYFRYYDAKENIHRLFVSRQTNEHAMQSHSFYETVLRGWISVFRKPARNVHNLSEQNQFTYYVEWNDVLFPLNKFRRRVYPSLVRTVLAGTQPDHIRELNPNNKAEVLRMIAWYNANYNAASVAGL